MGWKVRCKSPTWGSATLITVFNVLADLLGSQFHLVVQGE